MRILFVARRYPPDVVSGTETVFSKLFTEAIVAGHEVRLVAGFRKDRSLLPGECRAVDLRGRGAGAWAAIAGAAIREARAFRPDVVLSNAIEVLVPGTPTVTLVHDLNFGGHGTGLGSTARRLFYRTQAMLLARVIAVSDVTRQQLLDLGISGHKVVRIYNGVDVERFAPLTDGPLSRQDGTFRFVHVSRILPGKAQHASIDAFGRLRPDQRKGKALDIVGTVADPLYADQIRVQGYGLDVGFHFDVPNVAPYYQRADIALFPTLMPEGFGFAAVEAMACGLPVIHYADAAVKEATGGHAVEVARDDPAGLRDAMLRLFSDDNERNSLAERGRAWVQQYRWSKVWAEYAGVLAAVVGGRADRAQ